MSRDEKERVEECANRAGYSAGVMDNAIRFCGRLFLENMVKGRVLEMGPAEGVMTDFLVNAYNDYTVVDGAEVFVAQLVKRHPGIKGYTSLFEDYSPIEKYDNIVLGHVLEHVVDPVEILKKCGTWLNKGGRIVCAVPNSHSIHRQAAVMMGILESEKTLNATDIMNGHRRVYDMDSLVSDFENAGLSIIKKGGYWLKPLSNGQINQYWDDNMIDAFLSLGEKYPDIAGEIYVIATV